MQGGFLTFALAALATGFLLWLVLAVVVPARELLGVLKRIASGDFRPVILTGSPLFFRRAADHLRLTAETLARQKLLLAEEEFSLAMILGSMTEGVVITGPDLRIRLINHAAASMFNLRGGMTGLLLPEVFLSHELQGVASRAAVSGEVQHGELSVTLPGGERRHLMVTAAVLRLPEQEKTGGLLLVLHDVTRLRELESVRREFVANVSHEFSTPLSIINGYLETLQEGGMRREMQVKAFTVMRRHCDRLNMLIQDLLTISRMEEKGVQLDLAPVDIGQVLRGTVAHLESEIAARGANVSLKIPAGVPPVELDQYRIEQAFSNLLANALRHGTTAGGEVVVSVSAGSQEITVSFKDNGPGIPLQDQEHLFERFYRVGGDRARQTGGTGLGLSIVKNVVTAHGGRVALESLPGEGSTFSIFLPAVRRGTVAR